MTRKFIRLITLILICILLINFTFEPKVNAVGSAIALEYGAPYATKLLYFLYACLAAGVTFNALDEAQQMFDKWQADSNNWEPPFDPNGSGNNWKDALKELINVGLGSLAAINIIDAIKDWFQSLGAEEGENLLSTLPILKIGNFTFNMTSHISSSGPFKGQTYYQVSDQSSGIIKNFDSAYPYYSKTPPTLTGIDISYNSAKTKTNITFYFDGLTRGRMAFIWIDGYYSDLPYESTDTSIDYNVNPDSIILDNRDPFEIPEWYLPNIVDLPSVEKITKPSGEDTYFYPGTTDELIDEVINNLTFEDIKNSKPTDKTYTFSSTQSGTEIDIGEITDTPYPDVDTDPIEDTSQYQGESIGLLKSIINWLSNIKNTIVDFKDNVLNLPNKIFEVPQNISLDTSKLRLNEFQNKFPFSIPWDIGRAIGVFAQSPSQPDLEIDIDTEYLQVNHVIDISRIDKPLKFARYVASIFFILYLANKTRDVIKW